MTYKFGNEHHRVLGDTFRLCSCCDLPFGVSHSEAGRARWSPFRCFSCRMKCPKPTNTKVECKVKGLVKEEPNA